MYFFTACVCTSLRRKAKKKSCQKPALVWAPVNNLPLSLCHHPHLTKSSPNYFRQVSNNMHFLTDCTGITNHYYRAARFPCQIRKKKSRSFTRHTPTHFSAPMIQTQGESMDLSSSARKWEGSPFCSSHTSLSRWCTRTTFRGCKKRTAAKSTVGGRCTR